jgi:hypothetical protein
MDVIHLLGGRRCRRARRESGRRGAQEEHEGVVPAERTLHLPKAFSGIRGIRILAGKRREERRGVIQSLFWPSRFV